MAPSRKTGFEIAADAVQLLVGNQRAHVGGGIHAGADANVAGILRNAVDNFVENILFDVETRTRAAALAVVEENGAGGPGNGGIHVGIIQHDVGRLAAQFQRNFFQIAGGGLQDQFADFGRASKGNLIDIRMRGQRGAGGFSVARNDVHDAIGNARLLNQFAEAQAR